MDATKKLGAQKTIFKPTKVGKKVEKNETQAQGDKFEKSEKSLLTPRTAPGLAVTAVGGMKGILMGLASATSLTTAAVLPLAGFVMGSGAAAGIFRAGKAIVTSAWAGAKEGVDEAEGLVQGIDNKAVKFAASCIAYPLATALYTGIFTAVAAPFTTIHVMANPDKTGTPVKPREAVELMGLSVGGGAGMLGGLMTGIAIGGSIAGPIGAAAGGILGTYFGMSAGLGAAKSGTKALFGAYDGAKDGFKTAASIAEKAKNKIEGENPGTGKKAIGLLTKAALTVGFSAVIMPFFAAVKGVTEGLNTSKYIATTLEKN